MKLFTPGAENFGVLFAEDFDDEDGALIDSEGVAAFTAPPPRAAAPAIPPAEVTFSASELAQARRAGHEAGYAEGVAAAGEAAASSRTALLASMAEQLAAARADFDAIVAAELDAVSAASLAIVSACLPVLCEQAGTRDLMAVLRDVLPSLVGEPELVLTVHPDQASPVTEELAVILGKNTPVQVQTSASMGRSDVDVAWKGGSARRNTRALRQEVIQMLRRSLRRPSGALISEVQRHGR